MKTNKTTIKTPVLTALCLLAACTASSAATYTWDGGGANGNWNTGANWVGDAAPTGSGHILEFSGTNQLSSINNSLTSVNGLNFLAGAGAFTLSGNAFTLAGSGTVANYSAATQTINNDLTLGTAYTFNTDAGDIVLGGVVTSTAVGRGIIKTGHGTLTLTGSNTYLGLTRIQQGTILLNASTGSINSSSGVSFGDSAGLTSGNTSVFAVTGGNYAFPSALGINNHAANTIKADGIALTLGSYSPHASSRATTHFDVSETGSSISFTTSPTLNAGRIYRATVTDTTGTTSFATVDVGAGNKIVVLTGLVDLSGNPSTDDNTNAYLAGSWNNTDANRRLNSLTLQGASGGTVTGVKLQPREILMQEGTGDYTFDAQTSPRDNAFSLFVHQYSTVGVLTFNAPIMNDTATGSFSKAGPGTVHIAASSTSSYTGETYLQAGTLLLDGAFTKTPTVTVFDGAVLAGGGSLGSPSNNTALNIREGGTLTASTAGALDITGTLTFQPESTFAMTLDYAGTDFVSATGAITLNSGVDLKLTLAAAPTLDLEVTLLEGSALTGEFATINGAQFGTGGTFSLLHNSTPYDFQIVYDADRTWVAAIPEPSALLLTGLGAACLLLRRRARRA